MTAAPALAQVPGQRAQQVLPVGRHRAPTRPTPTTPSRTAGRPRAGSAARCPRPSCPSPASRCAGLLPRRADLRVDLGRDRRVDAAGRCAAGRGRARTRPRKSARRQRAAGRGHRAAATATASRNAAASRTVRASGPSTDSRVASRSSGPRETRPRDGLEPDQPAHAGRDADRAAAVAALRDRHEPAGHRRARAAAGPAGQPGGVPRRAGRRPDVGLGVAGQPELRRRRLADADRAGRAQQRRRRRRRSRARSRRTRPSRASRDAGDHVQVLDRGRARRAAAAGRRPSRSTAASAARPRPRAVGGHRDERPDLVVEAPDAVQRVLDELDRAHLAASDGRGRLQCGEIVQLRHGRDRSAAGPGPSAIGWHGPHTLVADPARPLRALSRGAPGMATAARHDYERWLDQGLALDLTRGKPSPQQLSLADGLLELPADRAALLTDKDTRNYGGTALGLPALREIFAPLLQVPADQLAAGNNSSLEQMYLALATSFFDSPAVGAPAWKDAGTPTFLCPVPGYDRHFAVCARPRRRHRPRPDDRRRARHGRRRAPRRRGRRRSRACGSSRSTATLAGWTCSPEIVGGSRRCRPRPPDFRVFWDNAYAVHHLTDDPGRARRPAGAVRRGRQPRPRFRLRLDLEDHLRRRVASPSSAPPPPTSRWLAEAQLGKRTIGPNRIVPAAPRRVLRATPTAYGAHMARHARAPRAQVRGRAARAVVASSSARASRHVWSDPQGGYFVSLEVTPGPLRRGGRRARRCRGRQADPGRRAASRTASTPRTRNIRIAPSFPGTDELEKALAVLADCVVLAAEEAQAG